MEIREGYIAKIETSDIDIREVDRSSFYVTCGFVNSHLHPNQLLDRRKLDQLPIGELLSTMHTKQKKTDKERYQQAMLVLIDALKSGATSMYAIASNPIPVIQAFRDLNLTGAITCVFNDVWEGKGNAPTQADIEDLETIFSKLYEHNTNDVKIHIGTASILTASNNLLVRFNNIAKQYNAKVNLHISEGKESVETCIKTRGMSPVRLLSKLGILNEKWNLIHTTTVDNEEVKIIADSGASIIHCPVSNAKTGVGIAPILEFAKHKVNIGIGTDACSNNNTNNIMNEAYFATLIHSAMHQNPTLFTEETVFEWMTFNGLKIIDSAKSGRLEVGERADLLLWSLRDSAFIPLPYGRLKSVFINNAPDLKPHTVLLKGKEVIKDYKFTGALERENGDAIHAWALVDC